jgi:hypothetical protein
MPNLIMIHGLKESGKSTLAKHLMSKGCVRVKMADPLKNMIRSLLRDAGLDDEMIERCVEGDMKEVELNVLANKSARFAMQKLGHEWRNFFSETLWVDIVRAKIESLISAGRDVVVDDIRYPHELTAFDEFNPMLWVITRGKDHFRPVAPDTPKSEIPMDVKLFHHHFANDWHVVDPLYREVDGVLARVARAA